MTKATRKSGSKGTKSTTMKVKTSTKSSTKNSTKQQQGGDGVISIEALQCMTYVEHDSGLFEYDITQGSSIHYKNARLLVDLSVKLETRADSTRLCAGSWVDVSMKTEAQRCYFVVRSCDDAWAQKIMVPLEMKPSLHLCRML